MRSDRHRRWRLSVISLVATFAVEAWLNRPLGMVPYGILALEFAWTPEAARKIVDVWSAADLIGRARAGVVFDYAFLLAYGWCFYEMVLRQCWTGTAADRRVARLPLVAAACDAIENVGLLFMLGGRVTPGPASLSAWFATVKFALIGITGVYLFVGLVVLGARRASRKRPDLLMRIQHAALTFADLRPSFVFGAIIALLPLTAIDHVPGWQMFGNLFVEYRATDAFWFGVALMAALLSLLVTVALSRDIQASVRPELDIPKPFPISARATLWYLPLALPALFVVVFAAHTPLLAGLALLAGGALTIYALMRVIHWLFPDVPLFQWYQPTGTGNERVATAWHAIVRALVRPLAGVWLSMEYFDPPMVLKMPHVFAVTLLALVTLVYMAVYFLIKYSKQFVFFTAHSFPPAMYLYVLLVPVVWLVSFLWQPLRRYRLALLTTVLALWALYAVGGGPLRVIGDPAHTFDVFDIPAGAPAVSATDVLRADAFQRARPRTLVVVAASGGGVLASAWTAKVLAELASAYPRFTTEARVISSVSGGSVAAAHYVSALSGVLPDATPRWADFMDAAMWPSLAPTAYGLAFADLRRALFPIWVTEWFDRGRLLEADWRALGNRLRGGAPLAEAHAADGDRVLVSDWRQDVRSGRLPAVIFNTTVMETGERIAITPIADLSSPWPLPAAASDPQRFHYPRTLGQFLGAGDTVSVDIWTAARLSATFAYVSPAARAAHAYRSADGNQEIVRRCRWDEPGDVAGCWQVDEQTHVKMSTTTSGLQHLIDGGYHDNYGVASALNWLNAALGPCDPSPFDRVAIVEIRARPEVFSTAPTNELLTAWLGPPLGLKNSWSLAQRSADDTAIGQMLARLKERCGQEVRPFVFELAGEGPLSWQLSERQKAEVYAGWRNTVSVRDEFLRYVGLTSVPDTPVELVPMPGPGR